jgi:hypothetical protein
VCLIPIHYRDFPGRFRGMGRELGHFMLDGTSAIEFRDWFPGTRSHALAQGEGSNAAVVYICSRFMALRSAVKQGNGENGRFREAEMFWRFLGNGNSPGPGALMAVRDYI